MSEEKKTENKGIVMSSAILAGAQILVRLIGLFYRVPIQRIIGDVGNGYYGAAYEIYQFILLLSANGVPTAVALLTSRHLARREYNNVFKILKGSMIFALIMGGAVTLFTLIGADWLAVALYGPDYSEISISLRVLAPTLLISAVMGVYRGFFQGQDKMMPTALSQLVEQIVHAAVSIIAASILIAYGPAWGAAGSTLGTCIGALAGLIFIVVVYHYFKPKFMKLLKKDETKQRLGNGEIMKMVAVTMAPVVLSSTIYQLSGIIDTSMFYKVMSTLDYDSDTIAEMFGIYSGEYKMLINVPLAVTSSIGVALIPAVTSLVSVGKTQEAKAKIGSIIKLSNLVAIPACVGLIALADPIMNLLYSINNNIPIRLLQLGAITVVTYSFSTVTIAILQGMGKMKVPVINSLISLGVHVVVVYIMLKYADMNIYALVYGNLVFSFLMCALNLAALYHYLGYKQEIVRSYLIPAAAAIIMGVFAFFVFKGIYAICGIRLIGVVVSILLAIIVYAILLVLFGGMNRDEILDLPKGQVLLNLLEKIHLIRE